MKMLLLRMRSRLRLELIEIFAAVVGTVVEEKKMTVPLLKNPRRMKIVHCV